jgi:surface protein
MQCIFYGCSSLTELNLSNWDTSKVTNMESMFENCKELITIKGIGNWDVSNVERMSNLFNYCFNLKNLNLSKWNAKKIKDTGCMFFHASSLTSLDLSNWDVSAMEDNGAMFDGCNSLENLNLSNWKYYGNSEYAFTDGYFFAGCYNLKEIIMCNSNYQLVNKIISILPTRTEDSPGTLKTGVTLVSSDMATANSKYWNIYNGNNDSGPQSSFFIGNTILDSIYLGSKVISRIYLGGILLYKKQ